jgi:Protein of unknown function (DUF3089)
MIGIVAALLGTAPPAAPPPDYSKDSSWLCLPGRADVCSRPLPTTALSASGYGATGKSTLAKPVLSDAAGGVEGDPPLDCFFVYQTSSNDDGLNSDLVPDRGGEIHATETDFARFASVCRPFAPLYRQLTLNAVAAYSAGVDIKSAGELAFSDVASAWRTYLAKYNRGRPFVLIGHSQGSAMLIQLIARDIEGKPIARQMKLAILPGYNVLVPVGKRVGGTFKLTPLCSRPGETGCVVSWNSFREKNPPPAGAMFGYADQPGMTVGCVNPARPGSAGWEKLDSYWYAASKGPVPGGPIQWSSGGPLPTPYLRTDGLVSGRCVNDGRRGYLEIHTNSRPGEKWTDHIGGEIGVGGMFIPGWGMHMANMPEAQADLIREVGAIGSTLRSGTAARR